MTDPIIFMARIMVGRKSWLTAVTVESDPIWSPAIGIWFVWTNCAKWDRARPWHVSDLPAEVRAKLLPLCVHAAKGDD